MRVGTGTKPIRRVSTLSQFSMFMYYITFEQKIGRGWVGLATHPIAPLPGFDHYYSERSKL